MEMPEDLWTAPGIISLSSLSLATDVTDMTLGTSDLWPGTLTGGGNVKRFWLQSVASWTAA